MNEEVDSWEGAKENVLPLKKGRKVTGLALKIENQIEEKVRAINPLLDVETNFEELLTACRTNTNSDESSFELKLLNIYLQYIKWTRDNYPTNKDKTLELLEVFK